MQQSYCLGDGVFNLYATCPSGTKMQSCAGGPGDLTEKNEGWSITPDTAKNACHLYIGHPACADSRNSWEYQQIVAFCVQQ